MLNFISSKPRGGNPKNWSLDARPGVFAIVGAAIKFTPLAPRPSPNVVPLFSRNPHGNDNLRDSGTFEQMHDYWLSHVKDKPQLTRSEKQGDVPFKSIVVHGVRLVSRYRLHSEFCLLRGAVNFMPAHLRQRIKSIFLDSKADVYDIAIEENTSEHDAYHILADAEGFLLSTVGVHGGITLKCDGAEVDHREGSVCNTFDHQ